MAHRDVDEAPKERPKPPSLAHARPDESRRILARTDTMYDPLAKEQVPPDLRDRLDQLQTEWDNTRSLRNQYRTILDFVGGDQIEHTPTLGDESADHRNKRIKFAPNMIGAALDKLSYLYSSDPVRAVKNSSESAETASESPQSQKYRDMLWHWRDGLSAALDGVDHKIRITGGVLALTYPSNDGPSGFAMTGESRPAGIDVLTFDRDKFVFLTHPVDRRYLGAVAVLWDTIEGDEKSDAYQIHHYWDGEYFAILKDWHPTVIVRHDMDAPPAHILKNTPDQLKLVAEPAGGKDMLDNLKAINQFLEQIVWTAVLQRGQWVFNRKIPDFALGPDVALVLGDDNEGRCEPNQANVSGQLDAWQLMLDTMAVALNMPRRTFKVVGSTPESGIRVIVDRIDTNIDRKARERLGAMWERGIARAAYRMLKWRGVSMPEPEIDVQYLPPPLPLTHDQLLSQLQWEYEIGIASEKEIKRRLHPHLSDKDLGAAVEAGVEALERRIDRELEVAGRKATAENPEQPDQESVDVEASGDVQKTALNGAQVTALQSFLESVSAKTLSPEAAFLAITNAFPAFDETDARAMIDEAAKHERPPVMMSDQQNNSEDQESVDSDPDQE